MMDNKLEAFISHLSRPILLSICEELQPILFQEPNQPILTAVLTKMEEGKQPEEAIVDKQKYSFQGMEEKHLRLLLKYSLLNPSSVEMIYERLSKYEHDALEYFIFHVQRDFLSYRQIEQGLTGSKPHTFRLGLIGLRRKGLIYTLRRQWGEEGYVFPSDLQTTYYEHFLFREGFTQSTNAVNLGETELYKTLQTNSRVSTLESESLQTLSSSSGKEKPAPVFQLIYFLLDDLRYMKDGRVPLTQKGTIHKRYLRTWEEFLGEDSFSLQEFDVHLEHQDIYSTKLTVLLDYLSRKGLISWGQEELLINPQALEQYMLLTRSEMIGDFKQYWFEYYIPKQNWMQSYYRDAWHISEKQEWLPVLHFVERWEGYYQLPSIHVLIEQIKEELLNPLYAFGLIEYAFSSHQELLWRWTTAPEQDTEVWVQPNLECFCFSLTPLPVLWRLTQFLTLSRWDQMLVLQPSEQKLVRATEQGVSLLEWLDWLKSITKLPVPIEFEERLKSIESRTQQVMMMEATLITVSDQQLLKAIVQFCAQNEVQVQLLTETQLVVHKQEEELVRSFLLQNHISIQEGKDSGKTDHWTEKDQSTKQQLEQVGPISFSHVKIKEKLRVESIFPSFTDAIPAWDQFPDLWKKQLVAYHERTKREILERAIQHQLRIQYETPQGELVTMKPVANQTLAGEWICIAENKGKIPLQDMKRMQLLFPDLTEP